MPDPGMRKKRVKKHVGIAQQALFWELAAPPTVPPEVLHEVHAALVELLLDTAQPVGTEVADEREGL